MVARTQIKKFDEKSTIQKIIDGIHAEEQAAQQVMEQLYICVKAGKAGLVAIAHAAQELAEQYRDKDTGKVIASNDECKRLRANLRYMCERNELPIRTIKCNDTTANTWSVEDATPQAPSTIDKATKEGIAAVDKKAQTFAKTLLNSISAKGKAKATLILEAVAEMALLLEIDPDDLQVALVAKQEEAAEEEAEAA